jgi:hypothetical protein
MPLAAVVVSFSGLQVRPVNPKLNPEPLPDEHLLLDEHRYVQCRQPAALAQQQKQQAQLSWSWTLFCLCHSVHLSYQCASSSVANRMLAGEV